jgi:hypothetical protein
MLPYIFDSAISDIRELGENERVNVRCGGERVS